MLDSEQGIYKPLENGTSAPAKQGRRRRGGQHGGIEDAADDEDDSEEDDSDVSDESDSEAEQVACETLHSYHWLLVPF